MKISLSFVLFILKFNCVYNDESNCGCGVDRIKTTKNKNTIKDNQANVGCKPLQNVQCSLDSHNRYTDPKKHPQIVLVPSGNYQVGTDDVVIEGDKEGPRRVVHLKSFYIDKFEVSNHDFIEFVEATKYKTEAEVFGDSFVFSMFLNDTFRDEMKDFRAAQAPWWYKINGADWRHPFGPESDVSGLLEHPVTHVSWNDAVAFCEWRNSRLPTEAEWEAACRGGHKDTKYPWGDKLFPNRQYMANIWQGTFPNHNSGKDGFIGTNPVQAFPSNDFGLHNMAGNVWEWVEDSWSPNDKKEKVKKGGSYLCHHSYCYRYRCSARSHNTEDSSSGNIGFRCAKTA